jgi:hypothetical protein
MFTCILIVLAHWNNSQQVDISLHSNTLFQLWDNQSLLLVLNTTHLAENQLNTNFIVF